MKETAETIQLNVSAFSVDAAKGQSDSIERNCVGLNSTCAATALSTGAQTPLDQNEDIQNITGDQRETDRLDAEAQKNQSTCGHSPVKLPQSQKNLSACSGRKKAESGKQNETNQHIQRDSHSKKKYAICFDEFS